MATWQVAAFAVLLCAQTTALPFSNGGSVSLLDESGTLLPNSDDEATVRAEVDKDIQDDVNTDNMGESPKLSKTASRWEKKAMSEIDAMSRTETKSRAPDKLSAKFAADMKQASRVIHGPKAKKKKQLRIDQEADAALADPGAAKKLGSMAEQAELDVNSAVLPVSLIEEPDIGEDDVEDDNLHLVSGSDSDIMKAINDQIGEQVSARLGAMPTDTMDPHALEKFEQDKEDASKFEDELKKRHALQQNRQKAEKQVKEQLQAAQQALGEAEGKDK